MRANRLLPTVTVIIPTKNRPQSLKKAIWSIGSQNILPKEIIIVDQSANPSTVQEFKNIFCEKDQNVKIEILARPKLSGLTAARNLGVAHATGEIIQFLDDDAVLEEKYFESLLPSFLENKIYGVCGRIIEPKQRFHPFAKYFQRIFFIGQFRQIREEWYHQKEPTEISTNTLPGVSAFRREVFLQYLFDDNLVRGSLGEDVEFSYRAGKKFLFRLNPRPKIRHLPDKVNRYDKKKQAKEKTRFYRYHFTKNIPKTFLNIFAYTWLNIGFILHAVADMSFGRLIGTFKGFFSKIPTR